MSALMQLRVRASRTQLRAPLVWIRHLGLDCNDVFLASYPRSGNTMLRFPLADLISGVPSSFDYVQRIVPEIGVHVHAFPLLPGGGRLIKTHERYRRKYARAIYIVRDVRDVALSAYARESAVGVLGGLTFDDYLEPFLKGKMSRWGSWSQHIESWLSSPIARSGSLLILRFEEIRCDIAGAICRTLAFLGVPTHAEAIRLACAANSIDKMRLKEEQSLTLPKGAEGGGLIRAGAVGDWQRVMSQAQMEIVRRYAGATLERLGYDPGSPSRMQSREPGMPRVAQRSTSITQ